MRSRPPERTATASACTVYACFSVRLLFVCCVFAAGAAASFALAAQPNLLQQVTAPSLHTRSQAGNAESSDDPNASDPDGQISTLPKDVSGAYGFDHLNESIELEIQRKKISGYITRLGDAETDRNTPLTFFFDHASVQGSQLQFQTRVVHGIWYSFRGTILRGKGRTRDDEGYYVLHGVLQEHHPEDQDEKSANETVLRRTVNFRSLGQ